MTPRPLHRWKSFWLGILVLGFIGWAWVRSMEHTDGVFWMPKNVIVTAGQSSGSVFLNWDGSRPPTPIAMFQWVHEPAPAAERWFPKAVILEIYPRQIQLTVAHWFLILLFFILWAALLTWRHLRQKRLAPGSRTNAEHPTSNAEA